MMSYHILLGKPSNALVEGLNGGTLITLNTYFFDCITLNS